MEEDLIKIEKEIRKKRGGGGNLAPWKGTLSTSADG